MTTHRGAYLHALGVVAEAGLTPRSSYLWTLPMFHCNGWAYTWAVTAMGALHVCLPKVEAAADLAGAAERERHPPLRRADCAHDDRPRRARPSRSTTPAQVFVGGAPPAPALLERAAGLNLQVTHLYGLTETYGPIAVCAWNPDWDGCGRRAGRAARPPGRRHLVSRALRVVDEDDGGRPRRRRDAGRGRACAVTT